MPSSNWQFEHSAECDASLPAAWAYWTEVANWAEIEGEAVEYVQLDGPFQAGVQGQTKQRGMPASTWRIVSVEFERSATIELPLDAASFYTLMSFEALPEDRTRITQKMWLEGDVPPELLSEIKTFEESAPQGLAKLARVISKAELP